MTTTRSAHLLDSHSSVSARKMRVLLVSGFVVDAYSSIEQSLVELSARPDPSIEFLWLVPDITWKYNRYSKSEGRQDLKEPVWVNHLRHHGIPHVVGNLSKYNALSNFLLFRDIFRNHEIDAVYTHFGFERFWTAFFGRIFGKVVIWHERWYSLGGRFGFLKRLFYRFFVDEFIAVSDFIKKTLPPAKRARATIPGTRVDRAVVLDPHRRSERRKKLQLPVDGVVVIMVANFYPCKRHLLALEVCRLILQKRPDVTFVFVGGGELRDEFVSRVRNAGIGDRVVAPGYVDNVDDYYATADISILTTYNEAFGNVVLESMRYALPVVSFDCGGPGEMIRKGETGFLANEGDVSDFAEKVMNLVEDERLRVTLGQKGREAAQNEFSREAALERVSAWVKDSIRERRVSSEVSD